VKVFDVAIPVPGVALPIGISFIVFHSISYLVDIYRHKVSANRNLLDVGVYLAMFPQLVAGPIIRYHTIERRIRMRSSTVGRASAGIRIFIIGLAQKVLIADEVARVADTVFDRVVAPTFFEAWLGVSAYTLQIYFDFSGYSNMAIGLAIVLGLNFPRNFRMPYRSRSVTEFWRRWHITLSFWFRDYVYIPLGGNRGSKFQTYGNLVAVFLLCGLWHGASWTFVIWGLHHGLFLITERAGLLRWIAAAPRSLGIAYALLAVMTGWVWFRARDIERAFELFGAMAGLNGLGPMSLPVHMVLDPKTLIVLVVGLILALWRMPQFASACSPLAQQRLIAVADTAICVAFFCLCALAIAAGSYSPFLYFRF
jgi:alginate O-acetyltransferase complex protein AlgI